MKPILITICLLILNIYLFAQPPQSFKYQAIARDASGNILSNKNVSFRISIIKGTITGSAIYTELHSKVTSPFGLVDLEIGKGSSQTGSFSTINWGTDSHFVNVEMDPAGGIAFQFMGASQLLSVPYALYAKDVQNNNDADADPFNEIQNVSLSGSNLILSKGGGTVALPAGDNWGSQVAAADATIGGNGVPASPLKINQQSATPGQILKWTGTTWLPANDNSSLWSQNGTNIYYNAGKVGIGSAATPTGQLHIAANSSAILPHIYLNETEPDYARIMFTNTSFLQKNWILGGILGKFGYDSKIDFIYNDGLLAPATVLSVTGDGELNQSKTGSANMLPVAYGTIGAAGNVLAGSGNFTCTYNNIGKRFEITITGESFNVNSCTALITCVGNTPRIGTVNSSGGVMYVFIFNDTGVSDVCQFHFVVYIP